MIKKNIKKMKTEKKEEKEVDDAISEMKNTKSKPKPPDMCMLKVYVAGIAILTIVFSVFFIRVTRAYM
jgi:hypothetical protein